LKSSYFNFNSAQEDLPYGTLTPFYQGAYVGDDVTIQCYSKSAVAWLKGNDKALLQGGNLQIENNAISIVSVQENQRGKYFCYGNDGDNKPFRNHSTLSVGCKFKSSSSAKAVLYRKSRDHYYLVSNFNG